MKNTVFRVKAIKATSFRENLLGLLYFETPRNILLNTRFGIHTFGLNYPIDIVVLDKKNVIVKTGKNLQPNRLFFWNPIYNQVLELPANKYTRLEVGRKVIIKMAKES